MKTPAAVPTTTTVTLTDGEAFVTYQALMAAKDKAILGLESSSVYTRDLSIVTLERVEAAMEKLVLASTVYARLRG